jgi:Alpha/beta hydrolase domain
VPDVAVPLGTHTGWAVRADVPDAMCGNLGQFIPFAYSKALRNQVRDPRLSLLERYPKKTGYLNQIKQVVTDLHTQRLLLPEDVAAYITDAAQKVEAMFTPPPKPPKEKPAPRGKGKKRARRR